MDDPLYDHSLSMQEHLTRAHMHAHKALDLCYTTKGTTRPFFFRIALARAQNILIKLTLKEFKSST